MNKSHVYIIIAAVFWGTIGIFVKELEKMGLSSMQMVFLRALVTAACIFIFILINDRKKLFISIRDVWMFIGTGILSFVLFNFCYFTTIRNAGLTTAAILLYTSPVFVSIFSTLLFNEKFTRKKAFALVLSVLGCMLVSGAAGGSNGNVNFAGIAVGVLSGFGYALYSVFARYALNKYDTVTVIFFTFLFAAMGAIPFTDMGSLPLILSSWPNIFKIIATGVITSFIPYICYTAGLRGIETSRAAVIATIEPVVAAVIGISLFDEPIKISIVLGIGAVIFAVFMISGNKPQE